MAEEKAIRKAPIRGEIVETPPYVHEFTLGAGGIRGGWPSWSIEEDVVDALPVRPKLPEEKP